VKRVSNKDRSFKAVDRMKNRDVLFSELMSVLDRGCVRSMDQYDKAYVIRLISHKVNEGEL